LGRCWKQQHAGQSSQKELKANPLCHGWYPFLSGDVYRTGTR
jgi:hypothetical protein